MKIKLNLKAQGLQIEKIVKYAVIALVLILLFALIFKSNIQGWIRDLPGYDTPEDKDIDISDRDDETKIGSKECPIQVGHIEGTKYYYFYDLNNQKSSLYFKGDSTNNYIYVDQPGWDDAIGEIRNGIFIIYDSILKQEGKIYEEVKKELPDINFVKSLEGAFIKKLDLCKNK